MEARLKGHEIVRMSVYADKELVEAFTAWRNQNMPYAPMTKAIETVMWDRVRADSGVVGDNVVKQRSELGRLP